MQQVLCCAALECTGSLEALLVQCVPPPEPPVDEPPWRVRIESDDTPVYLLFSSFACSRSSSCALEQTMPLSRGRYHTCKGRAMTMDQVHSWDIAGSNTQPLQLVH